MLLLLQLDHQYDVEDQPELDAFLMRYWHRRYHDKFSNLGPVFCDEELDMIANVTHANFSRTPILAGQSQSFIYSLKYILFNI
jgi:hypothetical protein